MILRRRPARDVQIAEAIMHRGYRSGALIHRAQQVRGVATARTSRWHEDTLGIVRALSVLPPEAAFGPFAVLRTPTSPWDLSRPLQQCYAPRRSSGAIMDVMVWLRGLGLGKVRGGVPRE